MQKNRTDSSNHDKSKILWIKKNLNLTTEFLKGMEFAMTSIGKTLQWNKWGFVLCLPILFSAELYADQERQKKHQKSKNSLDQQKTEKIKVNLAAVYSQRKIYRGALIWDFPIIVVGPSIVLFDTISLGGSGGISIYKKFSDIHTVSFGPSFFDDDKPGGPILKLKSKAEDFKNQRRSTFGVFLQYGLKMKKTVAFSFAYHKDLKRHKGSYFYSKISNSSLVPFVTLGLGIGFGDTNNNQYVYGPDGVKGLGHFDYFAGLFLPFLPGKGKLIINFNRSLIIKDKNVSADYIRGNKANSSISVVASWKVYEE